MTDSATRAWRSWAATLALCCGALEPAFASTATVSAFDAGFVTEAGGSAKGDGTVVSAATYNYSVGFELHYGTGALGAPLAPMFRRNYFVFDLSALSGTIDGAKLTLWSGTLESADASEVFLLKGIVDMPAALSLSMALAGATMTSEFDSPADPLVMAAATLYGKLGEGPLTLGGLIVTHAMDDSFVDIVFTPAGLAYLNGFVGAKLVLGGIVPSAMPPAFPQQPFGFTGPDIPGGDPKTPLLSLSLVPEPGSAWLLLSGMASIGIGLRRRRR